MSVPIVTVLAGPNGAGKSTAAPFLLERVNIADFVNADVIARGLSAGRPESVAIEAGRLMLRRLDELAERRISFAFETTLASRTFAPWIERLIADGYEFRLVFLALPSPEVAIARVADRVRCGGHHIFQETVRRRHGAGRRNFFELYRPLAAAWSFYDNSSPGPPRLVDHHERDIDAITEALAKAVRRTLWEHKRLGYPIAVAGENGEVVWIPPEEIPIPDRLEDL